MIKKEEKILVEQPNDFHDQGEAVSQIDVKGQDEKVGSTYGKFKNSDALLEAYNNLEKEFTKKCQALSKYELADNTKVPAEEIKDWSREVSEFVANNPGAKDFENEIKTILESDKILAESENPAYMAWAKIATQNFKAPQSLLKDEEFLKKYVFSDSLIKEQIIKDYIGEINKKLSPKVIGMEGGAKSPMAPVTKPKTLQEAGKIAAEMMK